MAQYASFELVGRLKATEQILAAEMKCKSWKVWMWTMGHTMGGWLWACAALVHGGLYAMVLALVAALALHRSGAFAPWEADVRALPLNMIFPQDYSAFGLAQAQRPARMFFIMTFVLSIMSPVALCFVVIYVSSDAIGVFTPEVIRARQQLQLQARMEGEQDMSTTTVHPMISEATDVLQPVLLVATILLGSLLQMTVCMWCVMSECFCAANDFSGAAVADTVLQQRISDEARELSTRIRSFQRKPLFKERALLYLDMAFFFVDFALDGLCAWQFLKLSLYWLFGLQVGIVCFAIWAESLLLRKRGLDICVFFHAFAESARYGFPTDLYLAIAMHEKCVEAPLSSLLQAYAVVWLPVSQPLGAEFATLLNGVKVLLSLYGTTKAVYVNMQLDLRRHLYALEDSQSDARRRLRSPRRQPQPGPGYRPGLGHEATARPPLGAPASVGGPRCPPGMAVHPPGGPAPGIAGHAPGMQFASIAPQMPSPGVPAYPTYPPGLGHAAPAQPMLGAIQIGAPGKGTEKE